MKKRNTCGQDRTFLHIERRTRAYGYRGRAVLRVRVDAPTGGSNAALHLRALQEALCAFAEGTLLPIARAAFEEMAAKGRAHAFVPHTYTLTHSTRAEGRRVRLFLHATYRTGQGRVRRTLCMKWSADGGVQYPIFGRWLRVDFL